MITRLLTVVLMTLGGHSAMALDGDREKPIKVMADSAERDAKKGVTTYSGDVVIEQGSLRIVAQQVTLYGDDSVSRIVATGKPAQLRQQPEPDKGPVTAEGNTVEYTLATEMVNLQTNAYLERDGMKVKGHTITYDMARQVAQANGDKEKDTRIEMVIPASAAQAERDN